MGVTSNWCHPQGHHARRPPTTVPTSLINFSGFLNVPGLDALKINERIDYSSYTTACDLLTALSNVIDDQISDKLKKSPVITILTDESTDIVVHHKLCINVRVVDPLSLNPSTYFLTDIQLEHANGKEIFEKISGHLKIKGIDMKNVTGLGTDGASVMTGRVEGLTGHFLRANPHIQNNHCSAHRLALCAEQAGDRVPTVVKFRETLTALYY